MVAIGLVVTRFDKTGDVLQAMESEARAAAEEAGAEVVDVLDVPGSFDTPLAADRLARREEVDAVAVIGAIITGETDHDQVIAQSAADALAQVGLDRDTPVTLGIIGPGMTAAEARERTTYGRRAVESAIALVEELEP